MTAYLTDPAITFLVIVHQRSAMHSILMLPLLVSSCIVLHIVLLVLHLLI